MANQRIGRKTYSYPRYWFSNQSTQIIEMFCEHLDILAIAWTKPRPNGVQIARAKAVASLDEFVGPKS